MFENSAWSNMIQILQHIIFLLLLAVLIQWEHGLLVAHHHRNQRHHRMQYDVLILYTYSVRIGQPLSKSSLSCF